MFQKEVIRVAKLQFVAGQARPGPALAGLGISMPEFTKQFNDQTKDRGQEPVPVKIFVFKDKSFSFKLFKAPVSYKILEMAKIEKGAKDSKKEVVATLTQEQLKEIAEYKMSDLNTQNLEAAMCIVAGSAKNMGVKIKDWEEVILKREKLKQEKREKLISELQSS